MTVREERAAKVRKLRDEGLLLREIAERLGMAKSTVRELLVDPDGSQLRARKDSYRGTCRSCGGKTDGSGGFKAPVECIACITWTEERVVEAMQRWADEHGGLPPRTDDWKTAQARYPQAGVHVIKRIGWNELLLKAGFKLRRDCRPETQVEVERLLREGWTARDVAQHFGWTEANVHVRLRTRGLTVKQVREAA
ncbi:MAG: hypothetical protein JWN10_926 [Solirubrobacterales bacterium]|nr:hypothetical protein [Solirubrobacterales bacterium]